jgi:transcriptional regulator with XRE-family HTH domain
LELIIMPRIGEVIKDYRLKAGLSQQELSEKIGVSSAGQQRIANWESGYRTPASEYLLKLMRVLHIPPEAFDEYTGGDAS